MDSTNKEITYTNEKEEIKEALDKLSVIKREEQEKLKKTLYVKYDYDFLTQVEKEITGKSSFFPSWQDWLLKSYSQFLYFQDYKLTLFSFSETKTDTLEIIVNLKCFLGISLFDIK